jgi:hypothetical protein
VCETSNEEALSLVNLVDEVTLSLSVENILNLTSSLLSSLSRKNGRSLFCLFCACQSCRSCCPTERASSQGCGVVRSCSLYYRIELTSPLEEKERY